MLTASDIRGLVALPPTPCKDGAGGAGATDSVDLEESARMTENLIQAGIGAIGLCGTTGECATLLWEEKKDFVDTVVQVARQRVPIFAGATALGSKEVVRQMRGLKELGADGAFVGLPMWQTPTMKNAIGFYAELSEVVPDMPITIYANARFFKFSFPAEFWEGLAREAPTVIATKISYGIDHLADDLRVAGHQINFLAPYAFTHSVYSTYKEAGLKMIATWATTAALGPEPLVALADAILRGDEKKMQEIEADIHSIPPMYPPDERAGFDNYNIQSEKWRMNAAGYVKAGPSRSPYFDLPEHWQRMAEAHGKAWAELRKKYIKAPAPKP